MNGKKTPNVGHILHCCPHTLTHAHGEREKGKEKGESLSFGPPFGGLLFQLSVV